MYLEEDKKGFRIGNGDKIIIEAIINPLTEKAEFLVTTEKHSIALITKSITIDDVKLVWG